MILMNIIGEPEIERNNIKECPFCGGSVFIITSKEVFESLLQDKGRAAIALRCKQCGVTMMDYTHDVDDFEERVDILLDSWNRRAYEQTDDCE